MENKDFNWREALMLFCIIIVLIETFPWISAQNETCTNETCSITTNSSINKTANCSEQLTMLLNTYNDLVEDYKNGTNCGTIKELLVENNAKLSSNLKECKSDVDKNKIYMVGFYFLFAVMIILIIYFIYMSYKPKSQEEKHE